MKTTKLVILFILSVFLFSGCKDNDNNDTDRINNISYPKSAKLKQISLIESINSGKIMSVISQYEYDELGRINKVYSPKYENGNIEEILSYDIYIYNDKNLL